MNEQRGVLFDLDGVIANTAKYHFIAWREIASQLGITITEQFNEQLKGVDRRTSFEKILACGNISLSEGKIDRYLQLKNDYYLQLLDGLTAADILPGMLELINQLRSNGFKIAIASASQNAPLIIGKLQLEAKIDYIADPRSVTNPKPAPDIFIKAAAGIGCNLNNCIGIEDSQAGVLAINAAGIKSISIGLSDSQASLNVDSTEQLTYEQIINL